MKSLFKSLSILTLVNILILLLGFFRELLFSYKFGVSEFADDFFYFYLLVEDFNSVIYTGLVFGLIGLLKKEMEIPFQEVFLFITRLIIIIVPTFFVINFFFLKDISFVNLKIPKYGLLALPFSLINGFLMSKLIHDSKIALAVFSRAINYFFIILMVYFLDLNNNYTLSGITIFSSYLIQFLYLSTCLKFSSNFTLPKTRSKKGLILSLKSLVPWVIAPLFVPFLSNFLFRTIFLDNPDNLISTINYSSKIISILSSFTFSVILLGYQRTNYKKNNFIELKYEVESNLKVLSYTLLCLSVLISLFSYEIISILFVRGDFTTMDAIKSSNVLSILIFSVLPGSFFGYLVRVYGNLFSSKNYYKFFFFWLLMNTLIIYSLYLKEIFLISYPLAQVISTTTLSILIIYFMNRNLENIIGSKFYIPIILNFILFIFTIYRHLS